jgi:hypothetical protein
MSACTFVWYELLTSDSDGAQAFYGAVLGWDAQDHPSDMRYTIVRANGKGVGGITTLPEGLTTPFWMGYFGVPDIDAAAARLTGAGGTVHRGPFDIPDVGRIALVADPQGAGFAMITGVSDQPSDALDMGPAGTYQLVAADGIQIGGMMNSPNFQQPAWLYYFGVDGIDAASARVTANGGAILHGPSEVPGGAFISQAQDPQGAMFALVGPRG